MAQNIIGDLQATKDQLGPSDTETLVFMKFDESITILPSYYEIYAENIGDVFTVGHATNGIVGAANGVGGTQITIGQGKIGANALKRIFNDKNIFCDLLRDTNHVDLVNSTATVDTTNFKIQF